MPTQDLLQRNLAVFQQRFPDLYAQMRALRDPVSRPVLDDGQVVDLDLGRGRLYGGDGRQISGQQVDEFVQNPVQVGYWVPTAYSGDSLIFGRTFKDVLTSIATHQINNLPMKPVTFTGYVFVLGLGLGHHLKELLQRVQAPHFVVCEPFEEFLYGSLQAIDWQEICDLADAQGKTLDLVVKPRPELAFETIGKLINQHGTVALDGSYFFTHYSMWALSETHRLLVNEIPRRMIALGYYEDERKMARNTATNLQRAGDQSFIMPGRFVMRGQVPAFLVGAGPSVDQCIETIRHWRQHVVLFSSGSALQVLLKNGIIPDYHTELENIYAIHTKLKHILDENAHLFPDGKFTGITLLGSATLNPNVRQFFDKAAYFFRDESCSSWAFRGENEILSGPAPTVANTSLACAARMGFKTLYAFGYDCGWRNDDVHHAKDTIYYTSDSFKTKSMKGSYALPGNFGGTVYTNTVFEWSRNMLEQAIRVFGLTVYNCSDGALLKGSTPKVAEAIQLAGGPIDRAAVLAHAESHFQPFTAGTWFQNHDFDHYRQELQTIRQELDQLVQQASANRWLFADFNRALVQVTNDVLHVRNFTLGRMVLFATHGIMKQAGVFLCRIQDADKGRLVMADFLTHFRLVHDEMLTECAQFVDQLQDWVQGGPEPDWTCGIPQHPGLTY